MKILVLTNDYPNTINEISCLFYKDQVKAICKQNIEVAVLSYTPISLRYILKKKKFDFGYKLLCRNPYTLLFQFPRIPVSAKINEIFRRIFLKKLINKYVKLKGLPDLIHAHTYKAGEFAMNINKMHGIPYVVTEHLTAFSRGALSSKQLKLAKIIYSNSNKNIAVSKEFSALLSDHFNVDFDYIPNVVDVDFFVPHKNKSENNDQIIFINVGHLHEKKNQKMLISAFSRNFKNNLKYKLWIVGGGEQYSLLKAQVQKEELSNQVVLWGAQNRDIVKELMQKSNFFVLSSLQETFGVVIIEAMSCGLPVVATKCGGPETIIVNEQLGLLTDINELSFAEAMKSITINKNNEDYIRNYIINEFSEKAVGQKLLKIYSTLINNFH